MVSSFIRLSAANGLSKSLSHKKENWQQSKNVNQMRNRKRMTTFSSTVDGQDKTTKVTAPFHIHSGETSIWFPLESSVVHALAASIDDVLETFSQKEKATRPQKYKPLDFKHIPNVCDNVVRNNLTASSDDIEISLSSLNGMIGGSGDNLASISQNISIQVFCNPNMHSNAFNASALVTVEINHQDKNQEMRFVTECGLFALKTNVDNYLDSLH